MAALVVAAGWRSMEKEEQEQEQEQEEEERAAAGVTPSGGGRPTHGYQGSGGHGNTLSDPLNKDMRIWIS